MTDYIVVPLGELLQRCNDNQIQNILESFVCERETDLEVFLKQKSTHYEKSGFGQTYLCLDLNELIQQKLVVMAYFTLSHIAVDVGRIGKNKRKDVLGHYPGRDKLEYASAFLIGQLGRSDRYTHNDLPGDKLIKECYHQLAQASRIIGGRLLVLDCREHMYGNFYEKQEFKKLYDKPDESGLWTVFKKINFSDYLNRIEIATKATSS